MTDDMPKISHTEYSTFKLAGPQQKNTDIIRLVFSCTQRWKVYFLKKETFCLCYKKGINEKDKFDLFICFNITVC